MMKKLLTLLSAIGLTATTSSLVVACQTEINGATLKDLAQKINADKITIAVANPPLEAKKLKDNIITNLTKTAVEKYGISNEGYFKDSKIKTVTVGELKICVDGSIQDIKIEKAKIEGDQAIIVTIEDVDFNFQINFSFNEVK